MSGHQSESLQVMTLNVLDILNDLLFYTLFKLLLMFTDYIELPFDLNKQLYNIRDILSVSVSLCFMQPKQPPNT